MIHKFLKNKYEAVSPVIAVILMVAITVVLAAILYVWVSSGGLAPTGGVAPNVSVTSKDAAAVIGAKPTITSAVLTPATKVTLTITDPSGSSPTKYQIYRKDGAADYKLLTIGASTYVTAHTGTGATTTTTVVEDDGSFLKLTSGTTYYYKVVALDDSSDTDASRGYTIPSDASIAITPAANVGAGAGALGAVPPTTYTYHYRVVVLQLTQGEVEMSKLKFQLSTDGITWFSLSPKTETNIYTSGDVILANAADQTPATKRALWEAGETVTLSVDTTAKSITSGVSKVYSQIIYIDTTLYTDTIGVAVT